MINPSATEVPSDLFHNDIFAGPFEGDDDRDPDPPREYKSTETRVFLNGQELGPASYVTVQEMDSVQNALEHGRYTAQITIKPAGPGFTEAFEQLHASTEGAFAGHDFARAEYEYDRSPCGIHLFPEPTAHCDLCRRLAETLPAFLDQRSTTRPRWFVQE